MKRAWRNYWDGALGCSAWYRDVRGGNWHLPEPEFDGYSFSTSWTREPDEQPMTWAVTGVITAVIAIGVLLVLLAFFLVRGK